MYASRFTSKTAAYRFMRAMGKSPIQAWAWINASATTEAGSVIVYGIGPAAWDAVGRRPD
jgi:hypothetical protein